MYICCTVIRVNILQALSVWPCVGEQRSRRNGKYKMKFKNTERNSNWEPSNSGTDTPSTLLTNSFNSHINTKAYECHLRLINL